MLTAVGKVDPLAGVNIGDSFMGGFYVGIIDTTKGNIIAADASQTGLRYALIVAPKSTETSLNYKATSGASVPSAASTRWDGLTATAAMNSATYPAAQYCAGLAHPSDAASAWYMGAMDELELLCRNLKPTTGANSVASSSGTFPGSQSNGYNPSSDPAGVAYTSGSPARTSVAAFQTGGAQALKTSYYWSATNSGTNAWEQLPTNGAQDCTFSSASANNLRAFRRLLLAA